MESDSYKPYSFVRKDNYTYTFVTDSLRVYEVYFIESELDEYSVVTFGFDCSPATGGFDSRIEITIRDIFIDFNNRYNKPVFFACSNSVRSAKARFLLFCRWFRKYSVGFEKYDYCSEDFYSALIVSEQYQDKQQIIDFLNQFLK